MLNTFLSKQYQNIIFHPMTLSFSPVISNPNSAIIPELNKNTQLSGNEYEYRYFYSNEQNKPIEKNNTINEIFQSDVYFMLINFQITNINDIYEHLNNIVNDINNHYKTINFIFNKIYKIFRNKFDDINIDKLVYVYINYFKKHYDNIISYYKMFTIIKNKIDDQNIESSSIHENIYEEILHPK